MGEQSGWMPTFPQISGDAKCMIGHHQAAIIADAWMKGVRGFDLQRAYKLLKKNAMEGTMIPWKEGPATELDRFYRDFFFCLDDFEFQRWRWHCVCLLLLCHFTTLLRDCFKSPPRSGLLYSGG